MPFRAASTADGDATHKASTTEGTVAGLTALLAAAILILSMMHIMGSNSMRLGLDDMDGTANGWVTMPAGAKSAFIGIHGGTLPVSLLSAAGGTSLVTFVGRTGNDFLDLLRRSETRAPSLLNATKADTPLEALRTRGRLVAGSPSQSLPVLCVAGETLASVDSSAEMRPFGLSDMPLSIEGSVTMPDPAAKKPSYHLLVDPGWLQPKGK